MLLAIDVGNTNVTIGVYDGDRLAHSWRLAALRERTADELGIFLVKLFEQANVPIASVEAVAIASVVPPLTRPMEEMCERYFGLQGARHRRLERQDSDSLYAPRRTSRRPARRRRGCWEKFGRAKGVPLIVLDFGTATTFNAISSSGEYLGGVICPGINISADALFQRAARLPRVDVRKPPAVIGQTTVGAMQSGLFFGYIEMVDGLVRRLRSELAGGDNAIVIATGGLADILSGESASIQHVDPNLTLDGLRLIWERSH